MDIKSNRLNLVNIGKVKYFSFPHFESYPILKHAFTTRFGGISKGIYDSMNLNFASGDEKTNVIENYKIICKTLGIEFNNLVLSSQTHESEIKCVYGEDKGKGITKDRDYIGIDGLITNVPNIPLVTLYADCVPIFFFDPVKKVIGLAHAGWKGTVKQIGVKMTDKFVKEYGSSKKDILVGIGPSIGKCCFEVESEVVEEFENINTNKENIVNKGNGKYIIDLWTVNQEKMIQSGIRRENIIVTDVCTKCNKDILFSHRGHNGKRGGMAAIIQLNC